MSDSTPRLALPYISSSQSQKEVTHNQALYKLEAYVQVAVESMTLTAPPTGVEGNLYIVAAGATGAWAGKDNYLAQYIGGAWNYYAPFDGMKVWDKSTSMGMVYKNSTWKSDLTAQGKVGFFGATPVVKTTVVMNNVNGAISSLAFSTTPTKAECEALRDTCETLADDMRNMKEALSNLGLL